MPPAARPARPTRSTASPPTPKPWMRTASESEQPRIRMEGRASKPISGTASFPARYEYGSVQDNSIYRAFSKEIRLNSDGTDTSEWMTNYLDAVARSYKTLYAAAQAPFPYRQSFYNNLGQLWKERDPDGVVTLYGFNAKGDREYTCIDSNLNDIIDLSGLDRITQTTDDVLANYSTNVVRTRTF